MFPNRIRQLAQSGYAVPSQLNPDEEQQQNNLSALAGGVDAVGSDQPNPLAELANMNMPITDRYKALLSQGIPQRSDYQPGVGRKILAALAGFGTGVGPAGMAGGVPVGIRNTAAPGAGYAVTNEILNQPYKKALSDYETQAKTLEPGARLEEQQATNKRLIAQAALAEKHRKAEEDIQNRRLDIQQEYDEGRIQNRIDKLQDDKDKLEQTLAQREKEFEGKQQTVQDQLAWQREKQGMINDLTNTRIQLSDAQHQAALAETKRQHDALQQKWQADIEAANRRADIAEGKGTAAKGGTVTTTETSTPPGIIGRFFGMKPTVTKQTTTTKTPFDVTAAGAPKPPPDNNQLDFSDSKTPPPTNQRVVGKTLWTTPQGKKVVWDGSAWAPR